MMWAAWHDIWGCATGPACRLAPQTRILAGLALFGACLTAPARTLVGAVFIAAVVFSWVAACGVPGRVTKSMVLLGTAMFLPYFLLAPLLVGGQAAIAEGAAWAKAFAAPWDVFVHGLSGLFVATATVAMLSPSDLRQGLVWLPMPRIITAVLIQIVHQTSELQFESRRISAAMAVRGATSGGRAAFRVLRSLPQSWLPRIINHADWVAAAMELRGYAESDLRVFGRPDVRPADIGSISAALGILGLAAALRCGWIA